MADLDWNSIREAESFGVGDAVRARGPDIGIIRNLIQVKDRIRARVYWPTIPFECEGKLSTTGRGSENFMDLDKISKVAEQPSRVPEVAGKQLELI